MIEPVRENFQEEGGGSQPQQSHAGRAQGGPRDEQARLPTPGQLCGGEPPGEARKPTGWLCPVTM